MFFNSYQIQLISSSVCKAELRKKYELIKEKIFSYIHLTVANRSSGARTLIAMAAPTNLQVISPS